MGWLNILAAGCGVVMLCARFRRRFEEAAPLAVCLSVPVLLVLAMAGRLSAVDWLALAVVLGAAAWLAWAWHTKRLTPGKAWRFCREYLFTPGLCCFALLGALFAYATSARHLIEIDEYNYWGTIVRSLWVSDGLVDGLRSCTSDFCSYPPGVALLEWWTLHALGRWSEPLLYFSFFFTNALFLLPLLPRKSGWLAAPVFCALAVALPTAFTNNAYRMLATDPTLGFVFGYALVWLTRARDRDPFAKLCVAMAFVMLVLAKQSGLIWVAFALLFDALTAAKNGEKAWRRLLRVVPAAVCFVGWGVYCKARGLETYLIDNGQSAAARMLDGTFALPDGFWRLAGLGLRQLALSPVSLYGWDGMAAFWGLPPLGWLAVFAVTTALCMRRQKGLAVRYAVFFAAVFVVYYIVTMLSYVTVFDYEFNAQLRYVLEGRPWDRYWIPVYFGGACLCCDALARRVGELKRTGLRARANALTAGLVAVALSLANWNALKCFYPPYYEDRFPRYCVAEERQAQRWLQAIDDPQNARVLVSEDYHFYFDAFSLPPLSLVKFGGPMYAEMSSQQFYERLDRLGVTHVYVYSDAGAAYETMGKRLDFAPTPGCLYRIDRSCQPYRLVALTDGEGGRLP